MKIVFAKYKSIDDDGYVPHTFIPSPSFDWRMKVHCTLSRWNLSHDEHWKTK